MAIIAKNKRSHYMCSKSRIEMYTYLEFHPLIFINFKMYTYLVFLMIITFPLMNNCYALGGGEKMLQSNYDTFDVTSFLSTTSCKASVQGRDRPASLEVTHRHGPCSKSSQNDNKNVPSLVEILTRDQSHVASIQNRHAFDALEELDASKAVSIPATSNVGFSSYVVTVGLGTPVKRLTLEVDTGSSLTWTRCKPQKDSIFYPSGSSSYSNVSWESAECSQLSSNPEFKRDCSASTCVYSTAYGSHSFSNGFLANERLTLTAHDVFDDFPFGCAQNSSGLFGDSAGLLALGHNSLLSLVSQTAEKYGKYFSYCLPTKSGSNGHLTFGKSVPKNPLVFTPFASGSSSFYLVKIVAINVAGKQLPDSSSVSQSGGTIIDSGTVITRLAPTAYSALRGAFRQEMSKYKSAPAVSILDTCYDLSNYTTVTIPKISFIFVGNAKVDLGSKGVLIKKGKSVFCLAFAANKADNDLGIFGNVQQQTFEVAYDVAGGRLGFSPGGCS